MGANSEQFIYDRDSEVKNSKAYQMMSFYESLSKEEDENYQAIMQQGFKAATEVFLSDCEQFDNGNIGPLELAIKFKQEQEILDNLSKMRKEWLDENKSAIETESVQYPNGYKGFKFSILQRKTYDFSNIQVVKNLQSQIKDIETKGKLALQLIDKGIDPVDANTGEILPIPQVKITSYLKTEKVK